jgi:calcineurin-like phosphoesterase
MPASFPVAAGEVRLHGALIEIDEKSGRAARIMRIDEPGPAQTASEPESKIDNDQGSTPDQT